MGKKLTEEQVNARLVVYDEILNFLGLHESDVDEEMKQMKVVAKQIDNIANLFWDKYKIKRNG